MEGVKAKEGVARECDAMEMDKDLMWSWEDYFSEQCLGSLSPRLTSTFSELIVILISYLVSLSILGSEVDSRLHNEEGECWA